MISIIKAKHLQDYKIRIEFSDGRIGDVDLKEIIHNPLHRQALLG